MSAMVKAESSIVKAAIINAIGRGFDIASIEVAVPIRCEVLVDVKASGLCRTDLLNTVHDMGYPMPSVFGHEVAGIVEAVGPEVQHLRVGDHVVACLLQSCGACAKCLGGKPFQCVHSEATMRRAGEPPRLSANGVPLFQGFGLGGFAGKALIHENQLVKVPELLPFPQGALLGCGVMTGAGSVLNTANVRAGDSVVVIGGGGVGLNAVSGAKIAGAAKIIVVDINDRKLETAKLFGATDLVNSKVVDPVEAVRQITGGGADHVFDVVGVSEVAQQSLAMLGMGGGLYLIGVASPESAVSVSIVSSVLKQTKVQGVTLGSSNFKRDIPMYTQLYLQGRMNLDDLVTKEIALDDINEGYELVKRDSSIVRVVITSF